MEARSRARLCVKQLSWQRRYGWNLIQRILTGLYCVLLGDLRLRFWVEEGNRPYGSGEARVSWGGQARWQMWVYNASPCSDKASTAGGENSQIVTNEQREVTHSNVDWAVRHTKNIWWHWFAMAVIYKWPSKKSAILTRSRWDSLWDLWSGCGFVFTSLGDIGRHQSVTITITARSQQMSPAGFHWSHTF